MASVNQATTGNSLELKNVKIYSPYAIFFDGPAESLSAVNATGPFDVLPGHQNFMSLLNRGEITVRTSGGREEKIKMTSGILHVANDKIVVFLNV